MKKIIILALVVCIFTGCSTTFNEKRQTSRSMLGFAMLKLTENDIDGALFELNKAKEVNPKDAEVYYGLALVCKELGRNVQAIEYCNKAIKYSGKLKEEHPGIKGEAYNLKGIILFSQRENDDALSAFDRALDDESYQTPEYAWKNIAEVYISLKDADKAKKALEESLSDNTHYAPAWEALSRVYIIKGERDTAINALEHAVFEFPGYTEAHWGLSQIYIEKGQKSEAISHLKEVVKLDEKGSYGQAASKKLRELGVE
jgi:type IV pilus assembly protein PilF